MKLTGVDIGQIVQSKSGRDKGRYFVVIANLNDEYALISDGSLRKIDKPKKKKIKHLCKLNMISNEIREAMLNNEKINDTFIIKELEKLGQ